MADCGYKPPSNSHLMVERSRGGKLQSSHSPEPVRRNPNFIHTSLEKPALYPSTHSSTAASTARAQDLPPPANGQQCITHLIFLLLRGRKGVGYGSEVS